MILDQADPDTLDDPDPDTVGGPDAPMGFPDCGPAEGDRLVADVVCSSARCFTRADLGRGGALPPGWEHRAGMAGAGPLPLPFCPSCVARHRQRGLSRPAPAPARPAVKPGFQEGAGATEGGSGAAKGAGTPAKARAGRHRRNLEKAAEWARSAG